MSDWVVRLIDQTGYLGVAFLMFLETIFPPIPSEVIMPVAGVAAGQGRMTYGWVVASGTAGAMLGNIFWYLAARALGIIRLKPIVRPLGTLADGDVARARARRALVPGQRDLLRVPRPDAADGTIPGFDPGRPAQDALPQLRSSPRPSAPPAGPPCSPAPATSWARITATSTNGSGPASNAILVVLAAGYVWRLWTHRHIKPIVAKESELDANKLYSLADRQSKTSKTVI